MLPPLESYQSDSNTYVWMTEVGEQACNNALEHYYTFTAFDLHIGALRDVPWLVLEY